MPTSSSHSNSTSVSIRSELVEALQLDLVGPRNDHPFANELLPESPAYWYLSGFLMPAGAPPEQRSDPAAQDDLDQAGAPGGLDDGATPDRPPARKSLFAASMGLSILVAGACTAVQAHVQWGDYGYEGGEEPTEGSTATSAAATDQASPTADHPNAPTTLAAIGEADRPPRGWRRIPRSADVSVPIPKKRAEIEIPNSNGLWLVVTARPISDSLITQAHLPSGTRAVSIFVLNNRPPNKEHNYRACAFQVHLALSSTVPFVPRPDLRGSANHAHFDQDWDERIADVQYRDAFEYAVGHGVSATWALTNGACKWVENTWIPQAEVERVSPSPLPHVTLHMEALGAMSDSSQAIAALMPLVAQYRAWQMQQQQTQGLSPKQTQTTQDLLAEAEQVAGRIEAGIQLLAQPQVFKAFCLANRCMAQAARQRNSMANKNAPSAQAAPQWRPFQLAFMLMGLRGIVQPEHADREIVDLLFFPTGGGKTEAYLGLAAFTLVWRRLQHPGRMSGGLSVLMRYTLRLLTLDQLSRATTLICALELARQQDVANLGEWPFEIGLWVGQAATPNRMGRRGDTTSGDTAYKKVLKYKQEPDKHPAPIPIEECPWCGKKFSRNSFSLHPNEQTPLDLRVTCDNLKCDFCASKKRHLPIVAVDEPIYRRLPAFMIATVDKFAALPWTGETGTLFGHVQRFDKDGYYGPMQPNQGEPLLGGTNSILPAPDLIIQDELHLISGPLGTIAGLYEAAIDKLCTREVNGQSVRPKIIASTATVRKADSQIKALFDRQRVVVFPPPGPNRRDSFFAHTETVDQSPARLYIGVAAAGRSLKVIFLRTALALLSAAQVAYERQGGKKNTLNPTDPYMTLLGYFNSLRELGGSRRIVEDEVTSRLRQYDRRRRLEPPEMIFTKREIDYEVLELTSRESTNAVSAAKRRLALPFYEKEHVDVALATNMISVGLDITRLGLMVVLGQPKTSAEYIQATSRVGRDTQRPGLVITLLNVHKSRDRSHYERFGMYHASFYRSVEATSVTPFSPRALDRSLPAVLVGLARLSRSDMTAPLAAGQIVNIRHELTSVANYLADRAVSHAWPPNPQASAALRNNVLQRCERLLDNWLNITQNLRRDNVRLQYQKETNGATQLLYDYLDPALSEIEPIRREFRANRAMRDVEATVNLYVKRLNSWGQHD